MSAKQPPSKARYDAKYQRERTRSVSLRFYLSNPRDVEILEHLRAQENTAAYLKGLVASDMGIDEVGPCSTS